MRIVLLVSIGLLLAIIAHGQEERSLARKGNQAYQDQEFSKAEVKFRKSLKAASDFNTARYNLANTLVKQQRYQQAAKKYQEVIHDTDKQKVKADAYHNLGNALLKSKKLDKSIKAYKNALRLDPSDKDTRYNLSYALQKRRKQKQRKQQQKQQKQQANKKQNKGQKQKGKQKNKQQQANKRQKQQQQPNNQQQQQQRKQGQQQQKARKTGAQKAKGRQMSKRQMEQILRAIQANEKDLQRKILKQKREGSPQEDNQKEW